MGAKNDFSPTQKLIPLDMIKRKLNENFQIFNMKKRCMHLYQYHRVARKIFCREFLYEIFMYKSFIFT